MTQTNKGSKEHYGKERMRQLKSLWLACDAETLKAFAQAHNLDYERFKNRARGWVALREELKQRNEKTLPTNLEAHAALLSLWWKVLTMLEESMADEAIEADKLKTLSAAASVLKATHQGIDQLIHLEGEAALTPIQIEGLDVEKL